MRFDLLLFICISNCIFCYHSNKMNTRSKLNEKKKNRKLKTFDANRKWECMKYEEWSYHARKYILLKYIYSFLSLIWATSQLFSIHFEWNSIVWVIFRWMFAFCLLARSDFIQQRTLHSAPKLKWIMCLSLFRLISFVLLLYYYGIGMAFYVCLCVYSRLPNQLLEL